MIDRGGSRVRAPRAVREEEGLEADVARWPEQTV